MREQYGSRLSGDSSIIEQLNSPTQGPPHVDITVQEGCTRCSFSRSVNERNEAWKGSGTGLRGIS